MPQTILALFAIIIASTLSLNQQRHQAMTVSTVVNIESDVAMAAIGNAYLDEAARLSFDTSVVDAVASDASDLGRLSPLASEFEDRFQQFSGSDIAGFSSVSGIDGLHGTKMEVERRAEQGGRRFSVEAVVGYVSEGNGFTPSVMPTKLKLVTIRVTPLDVPNANSALLSRLYSCGSACSW